MSVGKVEFCRKVGYPVMGNVRWSWGAMNEAGDVLMLVWEDESKRVSKGVQRVWLWGGAESDSDLGGVERKQHIDLIEAGARGVVAFCRAEDAATHESIADITPALWNIVQIEAPDERGRVYAIAQHPDLNGG